MRTKEPKQMDIDFSNKDQLKQLAIKHLEEKYHVDFEENWKPCDYIVITFRDSLGKLTINLESDPSDKNFMSIRNSFQLPVIASLDFYEDLDSILRLYYLGDKND